MINSLKEILFKSGKGAFDDPDVIIALETIGQQAGFSLFGREELKSFSLLHLD